MENFLSDTNVRKHGIINDEYKYLSKSLFKKKIKTDVINVVLFQLPSIAVT